MADIHVAAGLPPGHSDPCSCHPIASTTTGGGTIVIHRIAAPELLRPERPEASHALNTRAHGTRQDETGALTGYQGGEPCANCPHGRDFHTFHPTHRERPALCWASVNIGDEPCTCPGHQTRDRNAKAGPGALPDPAPQHG